MRTRYVPRHPLEDVVSVEPSGQYLLTWRPTPASRRYYVTLEPSGRYATTHEREKAHRFGSRRAVELGIESSFVLAAVQRVFDAMDFPPGMTPRLGIEDV
jgi:hypothetical protein